MLQFPAFMTQYPSTNVLPSTVLLPSQWPSAHSDEVSLAMEESEFEVKGFEDDIQNLKSRGVYLDTKVEDIDWRLCMDHIKEVFHLCQKPEWKFITACRIIALCADENEANRVCRAEKIKLDGASIKINRWRPATHTSIPRWLEASDRWITLFGVPYHLRTNEVLRKICEQFGSFIKISHLVPVHEGVTGITVLVGGCDPYKIPHFIPVFDEGVAFVVVTRPEVSFSEVDLRCIYGNSMVEADRSSAVVRGGGRGKEVLLPEKDVVQEGALQQGRGDCLGSRGDTFGGGKSPCSNKFRLLKRGESDHIVINERGTHDGEVTSGDKGPTAVNSASSLLDDVTKSFDRSAPSLGCMNDGLTVNVKGGSVNYSSFHNELSLESLDGGKGGTDGTPNLSCSRVSESQEFHLNKTPPSARDLSSPTLKVYSRRKKPANRAPQGEDIPLVIEMGHLNLDCVSPSPSKHAEVANNAVDNAGDAENTHE